MDMKIERLPYLPEADEADNEMGMTLIPLDLLPQELQEVILMCLNDCSQSFS